MISAEDIEAFADDNAEAITQAAEFARRKRKGLPVDRWATERQLHLVARGIDALFAMNAFYAAILSEKDG